VSFNAVWISYAHTVFAYSAFFSALIVGCLLHYEKIVENSLYGYPDEWFPSVSAAIGDRYPERSLFQLLIALTAGPRFLMILLLFLRLHNPQKTTSSYVLLVSGLVRTFTCGGWVYITSSDDHDFHDIFMIAYIVLTIPWTVAVCRLTPSGGIKRARVATCLAFFFTLVPLVYFFIQHKVHVVAGAYSIYAYFEWALILLDIGFDIFTMYDFDGLTVEISEGKVELKSSTAKPVKAATPAASASWFGFTVNTINSFMFFSMLTSLFLCVWHFPLWHMGVSGYELSIVAICSPIFLTVPFVRKLVVAYPQVSRVGSVLAGIGSYKFEEPENRLLVAALGNALAFISLGGELIAARLVSEQEVRNYGTSFITGLLGTVVVKYGWFTNNPIWPIMNETNGGHNLTGLVVGIIAALLTCGKAPKALSASPRGGSILLAALGLGGYLFSLHAMLTDASTLIYWSWEGYPANGPIPVKHSILTMLAVATGCLLSAFAPRLTSSLSFSVFGLGSAYVLYTYIELVSYIGGWCYAVYLAAMAPVIFISTTSTWGNAGVVLGFASFIQVVISLGHVWVVAYAFVPAGELLRERSDLVLGFSTVCVVLGTLNYKLVAEKNIPSEKSTKPQSSIAKIMVTYLVLVLALGGYFTYERIPTTPVPFNAESRSFTAGIWTIHFGIDNDMWASEDRMRDLLMDAQVDIVGLLESDTQRIIMGNRDLTMKLAHDMGYYVDFGPGPHKHTWGAALLSKFPIIASHHHLLPSPVGELAPAVHATLDIYGEEVDVVVFHSGQEEDEEDRRLQSLALQRIMGDSHRPMILLSYLVTEPLQGNYNTYVSEQSRMRDIDSTDDDRWCEYILFRDLNKVGWARISRSTITDTELQIAKFKLLEKPSEEYSEDELYGNNFIKENQVDELLRFPLCFYGDGVRDHRYHVFDEPRYFE
ncbi:hypothetical protein BABINDRAFT_22805, partial [Babjeviella inositovora NRRL Y-12698]